MKKILASNNRNNSPIHWRILAFVYALVLCSQLSACVKTPTQPTVVNKGDNRLQELISQPAVADYKYAAPTRWEETQNKGSLTIKMAADVKVPDVTKFPILQISPSPFTMEQVKAICQSFAPSKPLYEWHDRTKFEYESILVQAKLLLEKNKKEKDQPYGYASDERIPFYEDMELNSPDSYTLVPASMVFKPNSIGSEFVGITESDAHGNYLDVRCGNVSGNTCNYLIVEHNKYNDNIIECQQPWRKDIPMSLSVDSAESMAEKWMQSVGIQGFSLQNIGVGIKVDSAHLVVYPMLQCQPNIYKKFDNYFILFYTLLYNNIPCCYSQTSTIDYNVPESYNRLWGEEFIAIYISSDGIEYVEWENGNAKIDKILNSNIKLLEYSRIQNIILNNLFTSYANFTDKNRSKTTIEIEKVTLSYRKVLIKDQKDSYMLIPAWDIFGRIVFDIKDSNPNTFAIVQDENGRYVDNMYMHSLLTISALDGSVINTVFGY